MASATTQGPLEDKLLELLNKDSDVTQDEVRKLVEVLFDAVRDDVAYHQLFFGKTVR